MRWLLFGTVAMSLPAMLKPLASLPAALSAVALTLGSVGIFIGPFMSVPAMRLSRFCSGVVLSGSGWLKMVWIDTAAMLALFTSRAPSVRVMADMVQYESIGDRAFLNQERLPVNPSCSDFPWDRRRECNNSVPVRVQSTSPQPTTIFGHGHIGKKPTWNGRFIEMLHVLILPQKASYGRI